MDWDSLFNEFCQTSLSVTKFLIQKGIDPKSGNSKQHTKGWSTKRAQIKHQISEKTQEKYIEKTSTEKAKEMVTIESVAKYLLDKIQELSIDNTRDLKSLSSALKDLHDVTQEKEEVVVEEEANDSILQQIKGMLNEKNSKD